MSDGDMDRLAGKVKELSGKLTGDKELEGEGKAQHAEGKVENAIDDAGAKAKGAVNAIKDKLSGDKPTGGAVGRS